MLRIEFPLSDEDLVFLGNQYSGYWFPEKFLAYKGTIWGVGLGHDSSFEFELVKHGYEMHGFEPETNCFYSAKTQFFQTNANLYNYGLWYKSGRFNYTGSNISIVNIFDLESKSEVKLEIKSLWQTAKELNLKKHQTPRILKLNIEGAELEILLRLLNEPLEFEIIIFQAEFLFHLGFKRLKKKIQAYYKLRKIISGFSKADWELLDFQRNQITLARR